jgi:hypothetical protein
MLESSCAIIFVGRHVESDNDNVLYTKATIKYTNLENRIKFSKSIPVGFIKLELA